MTVLQNFDIDIDVTAPLPAKYEGFEVKNVEITQRYGAAGSTAKLDVVFDDDVNPDGLKQVFDPLQGGTDTTDDTNLNNIPVWTIEVETTFYDNEATDNLDGQLSPAINPFDRKLYEAAGRPVIVDSTRDKQGELVRAYTGHVTKVVQKTNGIVTIELLDKRLVLNRAAVKIDTNEDGQYTDDIIRDLLGEIDLLEGIDKDYYIGYSDPEIVKVGYGLEEATNLYSVLQNLALREGVHMWIDRYNTLRFEERPTGAVIQPEAIIDVKAGQENDPQKVIGQTPYDGSGSMQFLGIGTDTVKKKVGRKEKLAFEDKRTVYDPNVITESGMDKRTMGEFMANSLRKNRGTVKLMGTPLVTLYDDIVLTDMPELTPLAEDQYGVKTITHTISQQKGFITELELSDSVEEILQKIRGQSAEAAKRLDPKEKNIREFSGNEDLLQIKSKTKDPTQSKGREYLPGVEPVSESNQTSDSNN